MSQRSLKQILGENLVESRKLESSTARKDSEEYQSRLHNLIQEWLKLKELVGANGLFSINESVEDINTAEFKFLSVDFYLARLYAELVAPSKMINVKKCIICYLHFLTNLYNYDILDNSEASKYQKIKESPFEVQNLHDSAMLRRDEKIAIYKLEKTLNEKLTRLEKLENDEAEYHNADEDEIRALYLAQLKLYTIKTFDNIRFMAQELEILQHFAQTEQKPKIQEIQDMDEREKSKSKDDTGFTEKLETIDDKKLLNKQGKILRPFTLLKRSELNSKVFGTGQYLPTMTVEEFLEQELANGGMITGGGNEGQDESSGDEDDFDKADRETYKQREWDEFAESHAKGSGNTTNRG